MFVGSFPTASILGGSSCHLNWGSAMKRFSGLAVLFGFLVVCLVAERAATGGQERSSEGGGQPTLEQLQKERIQALLEVNSYLETKSELNPESLGEWSQAKVELFEAKLDAADRPAERVALLKKQLEIAQLVLDRFNKQRDAGIGASYIGLFRAKVHRLDVEIKLAKEEGKAARKANGEPTVEQLHKERIEALGKIVAYIKARYTAGGVSLDVLGKAQDKLVQAKLDATEKLVERIALLKEQLEITKDDYDFCRKQRAAGFRFSDVDVLRAQAHSLAAAIRLAKEEHKEPVLGQLHKERIEALEKVVDDLKKGYETLTNVNVSMLDVNNAQEELVEAKLESTDQSDERIPLLKEQLKIAQGVHNYFEERREVDACVADLSRAKAHCLAIQMKLVKEGEKVTSPR
jgi:hypothetical protein